MRTHSALRVGRQQPKLRFVIKAVTKLPADDYVSNCSPYTIASSVIGNFVCGTHRVSVIKGGMGPGPKQSMEQVSAQTRPPSALRIRRLAIR